MSKKKLSKLLALYLPYVVIGLVATNLGEAWRLAAGKELGDKIVSLMDTLPAAFSNPLPSLHLFDLFIGLCCGAGMRLAVYLKGKNAKKYRHGMEYGSARWGTPKDIEPFMAPKFADNIILTKTERLMMSNRPLDPKNARNKNVLVVGGSGSGKTRFFIKPNLLQCNSKDFPVSFVVTDPNGRIIRQGNQNKQVYVYNYVTESTFDAYLYQTLENKQKFISQIMTSKSPMRSCDDIDEQALSYAEIKALCAGDPRIREKMDLDVQVAKLKVLRGDFQNQKYRLEDKLLKTFPEEIQKQKTRIAALQQDSQIAATHPQDKENFCGMTIKGMVYDDKKAAGERLLLARQEMPNADMMLLGTYRGFELDIRFDSFKNEHQAVLRAELSYPVSLGDDARGNITRLDNAIDNFADRIADAENALQNLEQQKQAAEVEVAKPFAQEEELAEKSARLAELNALLNIDRDRSSSQDTPEESEETEAPATRPSVLAALEEKVNQPEPVKPFKSYLDKEGR